MKKINLPDNKFAVYDDEFEELVNSYEWRLCSKTNKPTSVGKITIKLVNLLMNTNNHSQVVVNKNNNIYDCQKSNLQILNKSEFASRLSKKKSNKIGYKGVTKIKSGNFTAQIKYKYKIMYLGVYEFAKDAAEAYNKKAKELFGELAYQNKIN